MEEKRITRRSIADKSILFEWVADSFRIRKMGETPTSALNFL